MDWQLKSFKELTRDELYEILKIRNEVFVVEQECSYQDCDGKDEKSYHLYCEKAGMIAAYLRILQRGVSYAEISIGRVLVKKIFRGEGLARVMMTEAIEFIKKELMEKEIRISAQAYLVNFYESLGFRKVSDEYLEDDIPHVEMLLRI